MFKKPIEVQIDARSIETKHELQVSPDTFRRTTYLVEDLGKTTVRTVTLGAAAVATSQILVHIAKTYIK